jgi:calcium permeable stress-gated cation channel
MPYYSEIPRILLFGLIGLAYFIVAPLILPFVLVYFCLGYFIFRNQVRTLQLFSVLKKSS